MPRKSFNRKVDELKREIEKSYLTEPLYTLECCETLEQLAYEVDSHELRAYCMIYKGLAYYTHYELDRAYETLLRSVDFLLQTKQWALAGKAYNALGNLAYYQGEFSMAVDYFFLCIRFCREHGLKRQSYLVINNIADMYLSLGESALAAEELKLCEEALSSEPDALAIIYGNLTTCYIRMGDLKTAEIYLKKTESACEDTLHDRCFLALLQTDFYHYTGDAKKRDETIETLRGLRISTILYDFMTEIESHAFLLIEIGRYDALEELLAAIDQESGDGLSAKEMLCKLRLEYYQKIGAEQEYLRQTAQYHEINKLRDHQRRQIAVHHLVNRRKLENEVEMRTAAEQDNLILRQRSEQDALTGIKNRFKLNEVAETAFQHAYRQGTPLAIELLDIDCYKEYNDNYGHQAGDECLIAIARVLKELEANEGVHVGRYGGDEFMVIYENYTREQVTAFAEQIKAGINALQVEHKHSRVADHVTVSQGIFYKIPEGSNRLWDFTYCADFSLYYVKGKSRNDFFLSTSVQEIKDFAGDDSGFAR